jgi:Reverse transcriptase (RNA-dependent DNA polymerase).
MLKAGVIERSQSAWSTPVVMVSRPNGAYRFCLDIRKINAVTRRDAYPLPQIHDILDRLRSARYISTIDLRSAYHQIPLEESSKEITAFTVPGRGLFHFKRMPFGLTNAPATFQRLLDRLIGSEMEPNVFAYLDDIIVVTETFADHLDWLRRVLRRIVEAGLEVNPDKSKFCRSEVRYLGFL